MIYDKFERKRLKVDIQEINNKTDFLSTKKS